MLNQLLSPGDRLVAKTFKQPVTVDSFIAGGGQGEVYLVGMGGKQFALKCYYPASSTSEQLAAIERVISFQPPSDAYLWPIDIVKREGDDFFGYLMKLRTPNYRSIPDFLLGRLDPSMRTLVTACFKTVDEYFLLHKEGLCYADINFGNVFFDPASGEVIICDNDNVTVNNVGRAGVRGTMGFMAPELTLAEARPRIETDLHALAVLLFYLLCGHHPFQGKEFLRFHCHDLPFFTHVYGKNPIFIFHPTDETNRPVPGEQDNPLIYWDLYPKFLKDLFVQTFVAGVRNPDKRTRPTQWRAGLVRLHDAIVDCVHCEAENFHDADSSADVRCWRCGKETRKPFCLAVGEGVQQITVSLGRKTRLFHHHLDGNKRFAFGETLADVDVHPQQKETLALRNLTGASWTLHTPAGEQKEVPPQKAFRLAPGMTINFGTSVGKII